MIFIYVVKITIISKHFLKYECNHIIFLLQNHVWIENTTKGSCLWNEIRFPGDGLQH